MTEKKSPPSRPEPIHKGYQPSPGKVQGGYQPTKNESAPPPPPKKR